MIPTVWRFIVESFELVDDPAVIAAAAPGEQPWKAVLIEEGIRTSDHRLVEPGALGWRALPLTLGYQSTQPDGFNGHGGAVASGRIETIERVPHPSVEGANRLLATGAFTADDDGVEAARAVRDQKVRGISADVEAIEVRYDAEIDADSGELVSETEVLVDGRVMGGVVTGHPAFADALIEVDGDVVEAEPEPSADDGEAIAAAARPGISSDFFADLNLERLTPFTVEAIPGIEGTFEVFGHIGARNVCHLGLPGCRTIPIDGNGYSYFHLKSFETTDLGKIDVGVLTLGGFHSTLRDLADRDIFELQRSFEDMESVACYVRAGHDEFGVWIHGVTRAGMTTEDVELLTASNPSGEWKPIRGRDSLVRVHNVPVPGFPVPRTLVASALYRNEGGEMTQVAYQSAGVPRDPICPDLVTPEDLGDLGDVSEPLAASALPAVASTFESHNETLDLILERLTRIERTQAAMARFGSYELPSEI